MTTKLNMFVISLTACLAWYCYYSGAFFLFLYYLIYLLAAGSTLLLIRRAFQGQINWAVFRRPLLKKYRRHWLAMLNQWLFLVFALIITKITIPTLQHTEAEYQREMLMIRLLIVLMIIVATIPYRTINLAFNLLCFIGNMAMGYECYKYRTPPPLDESMVLAPPASTRFYIVHGGSSTLISPRYNDPRRRYSVYVFVSNERFLQPGGGSSDGYRGHTFGEPVVSPVEGIVRTVVSHLPDMPMGKLDNENPIGNHIFIEIRPDRFLIMNHLQQDSVVVKPGERVNEGQLLASCGKSGRATEPVLHMIIVSSDNVGDDGVVSFPFRFKNVRRVGSDDRFPEEPLFPRRNDFFEPIRE